MTQEEALEAIDLSNKEAQAAYDKGLRLKEFMETPAYKEFVTDGFLDEYPKELGLAIAKNTGAYDADALAEMLKGINVFVGYVFRVVGNMREAEQTLADNKAYLDEQEG